MKILYLFIVACFFLSNIHASKHKSISQLRDERINLLINQHNNDMRQLRREIKKEIKESKCFNKIFFTFVGAFSLVVVCDLLKFNPLFLLTKAFTRQPTT